MGSMVASYCSYVIRVRRPTGGRDAVRLDLEDLLGGGHVVVVGDEARSLADRLLSMLDGPAGSRPDGAQGHRPCALDQPE